jgi:hypothetical protein
MRRVRQRFGPSARPTSYEADLEADDLVRPARPVRELVEARAARPLDERSLVHSTRVHATAAESDLSAVPGGRGERPLQVVVAVRRPPAGHRAPDSIWHEEDPDLLAIALRQRVREPHAVVEGSQGDSGLFEGGVRQADETA